MKRKVKPCKCGCGRAGYLFSQGMLKGCYLRNTQQRRSIARTVAAPSAELTNAFALRMRTAQPICDNCGAVSTRLKSANLIKQWKSCQAHILPKRHFKSIQANPLNFLVLGSGYSGLCYCHDNYDMSWAKASTMAVWPLVLERVRQLLPFIAPSEMRHLPDCITNALTPQQ